MKNINYIEDPTPSYSPTFNVESRKLWMDKLPFNIFNTEGYLTDGAKNYIKINREAIAPFKKGNTWADAILAHAEFNSNGFMVPKSAPNRSDVKASGSMHMEAHMNASDKGESYDPHRQQNSDAATAYEDDLMTLNYHNYYRVNGRNVHCREVFEGETRLITPEEADQWYNESINNK